MKTDSYTNICLIAGSEQTKATLATQLLENFQEAIRVTSYALDSGIHNIEEIPKFDLLVLSSMELKQDMENLGLDVDGMKHCICNRTLDFAQIEDVIEIPRDTQVLFVNDSRQSAEECIQDLLEIDLDHIKYIPWYPELENDVVKEIAITAGEARLVPKGVKKVINLGPRIIDVPSLLKIAESAGIKGSDGKVIIRPYTRKIIDISKKVAMVNAETEVLKQMLRQKLETKGHIAAYTFESILGESSKLKEAKNRSERLGKTDLTVLIEGESGTGKELFASAIHNSSTRRNGPYLAVNFSALPEELLESELFGYEEGAFTGAKKGGKVGLFEQADGGTIFLDEIGDISPRMQTKLLRVIQEKEIMPLGSASIKKVDVRVVAATNKNLKSMVERGLFRGDLYYRLRMGYVYLPPLRERKEDIIPLAKHFVKMESRQGVKVNVDDHVFNVFMRYDWHGNIREVANTIKYMMAVREQDDRIAAVDLPDDKYFEKPEDDFPLSKTAVEGDSHAGRKNGDLWNLAAGGSTGMAATPEKPDGDKDLWMSEMDEELESVLMAIGRMPEEMRPAGRQSISELLLNTRYPLSENQVRNRLGILERLGLVKCFKGRRGTVLTAAGRQALTRIEKGNQPG